MAETIGSGRRRAPWAPLLLAMAATHGPSAADIPVEDFEKAGAPSPWVFSNGPEFAGAKGILGVEPSQRTLSAHLPGIPA